jgi:hypothetical protein
MLVIVLSTLAVAPVCIETDAQHGAFAALIANRRSSSVARPSSEVEWLSVLGHSALARDAAAERTAACERAPLEGCERFAAVDRERVSRPVPDAVRRSLRARLVAAPLALRSGRSVTTPLVDWIRVDDPAQCEFARAAGADGAQQIVICAPLRAGRPEPPADFVVVESVDGGAAWSPPLATGLFFEGFGRAGRVGRATLNATGVVLPLDIIDVPGREPRFPDDDRAVVVDWSLLRRDSDGDGLTDLAEDGLLTDPRQPDTDGDGIGDDVDRQPLEASGTAPAARFGTAVIEHEGNQPSYVVSRTSLADGHTRFVRLSPEEWTMFRETHAAKGAAHVRVVTDACSTMAIVDYDDGLFSSSSLVYDEGHAIRVVGLSGGIE